MILDVNELFSDDQAITATADSNIFDLGSAGRDVTLSDDLFLFIKTGGIADFAAAGAATMDVQLLSSDASDFGSGVTTTTFGLAIPKATLVHGYVLYRGPAVGLVSHYNKFTYTVHTGPFTAGVISAGIVAGIQAWKAYSAPNQA